MNIGKKESMKQFQLYGNESCKMSVNKVIMSPFEEEGVYCIANVGRSVGRPNGFR